MKALFGNSCAKGCVVYVVALIAIVAVTSMGLGGLKGRFAVDSQTPQGSILTIGNKQPAPGNPPSEAAGGGTLPTIAPLPPIQTIPAQTAQPTAEALPTLSASAGPTAPAGPIAFTPVPSQGGVISGETVAPFYIVQSGDTLWEIALRFGVSVDALRAANNLSGDIIQPGQVLTLPQITQPQQQPQPTTVPTPKSTPTTVPQSMPMPTLIPIPQTGAGQPTVVIPFMPNTGIVKEKDGTR